MELERTEVKIVCDIPGCMNYADYTLKLRKFWNLGNTNFCKSCLTKMHSEVGKVITPKSPQNILKTLKNVKKEKAYE